MRKDIQPNYHPRSPGTLGESARYKNPHVHNCILCRHIEGNEVERKVFAGWRYCDIIKAHPWIKKSQQITDHFDILGLTDEVAKRREIKSKDILKRVIRAGLPGLEEGKVYPRDVIEATKALEALEGKQQTEAIWDIIQGVQVVTRIKPKDENNSEQTPRFTPEENGSTE